MTVHMAGMHIGAISAVLIILENIRQEKDVDLAIPREAEREVIKASSILRKAQLIILNSEKLDN